MQKILHKRLTSNIILSNIHIKHPGVRQLSSRSGFSHAQPQMASSRVNASSTSEPPPRHWKIWCRAIDDKDPLSSRVQIHGPRILIASGIVAAYINLTLKKKESVKHCWNSCSIG